MDYFCFVGILNIYVIKRRILKSSLSFLLPVVVLLNLYFFFTEDKNRTLQNYFLEYGYTKSQLNKKRFSEIEL